MIKRRLVCEGGDDGEGIKYPFRLRGGFEVSAMEVGASDTMVSS